MGDSTEEVGTAAKVLGDLTAGNIHLNFSGWNQGHISDAIYYMEARKPPHPVGPTNEFQSSMSLSRNAIFTRRHGSQLRLEKNNYIGPQNYQGNLRKQQAEELKLLLCVWNTGFVKVNTVPAHKEAVTNSGAFDTK